MIAVLLVLAARQPAAGLAAVDKPISTSQLDLAAYAATIENGSGFRGLPGERGVGTEGGSEDHTAILCSAPGHLTQFRYRPGARERTIALPDDVGLRDRRQRRAGAENRQARDDYNRAARSAAEVLDRWRTRHRPRGRVPRRGDSRRSTDAAPACATCLRSTRSHGPPRPIRRGKHRSCPAAADRLAAGDLDGFGTIVDRSQALAERLLRNQVPETAGLARLARAHGAGAASAFGAGFGGSVWALVGRAEVPRFVEKWQNAYRDGAPGAGRAVARSSRCSRDRQPSRSLSIDRVSP